MVDYNIFIDSSRGFPMFIVNGEVCRFNDYDYADQDDNRQEAMWTCREIINRNRGGRFHKAGSWEQVVVSLAEVPSKLLVNSFSWALGSPEYLTADDHLTASIQLAQNILKLSTPGDIL